jgi:cobyrinic acid a,c-diamide synthase
MQHASIPRIVIAGTHSGVGKTTIVTGLLAALRGQGLCAQSYKVGPDYIDPGYHQLASGQPAHNLDTWLLPPEKMKSVFAKTSAGKDIVVIEGVMGLYDGGRQGISSTAAVAKMLKAPVVLVIDARSMGESAAAVVLGYKTYDPEVEIAGVIINRLGSETHRQMVVEAVERLGIPVIGALQRNTALTMPERHLGLMPVTENEARDTVTAMGRQIAADVAVDRILSIARQADVLPVMEPAGSGEQQFVPVKIGIARDEVFSFYYPESLNALADAGAELIFFSPLHEQELPDVDGLIFGGGFPEMFIRQLYQNAAMRQAVYRACSAGMPVYAECGGLMYLSRQIVNFEGKTLDMAGVVPAVCTMQSKLETVGYVEVEALSDNVLCAAGDKLRGHEFHFSSMIPEERDTFPWAFEFTKVRNGQRYSGGFSWRNVVASYLHMHFAGNEKAAARFVDQCRIYRSERSGRE